MIRKIYKSCRDKDTIDLKMVDEIVAQLMVSIRESNPLKLLAEINRTTSIPSPIHPMWGFLPCTWRSALVSDITLTRSGQPPSFTTWERQRPLMIFVKGGPFDPKGTDRHGRTCHQGGHVRDEIERVNNLVILAAMEHHIKYDGSGYPRIKGGWERISSARSLPSLMSTMPCDRCAHTGCPCPRIKSSGL